MHFPIKKIEQGLVSRFVKFDNARIGNRCLGEPIAIKAIYQQVVKSIAARIGAIKQNLVIFEIANHYPGLVGERDGRAFAVNICHQHASAVIKFGQNAIIKNHQPNSQQCGDE